MNWNCNCNLPIPEVGSPTINKYSCLKASLNDLWKVWMLYGSLQMMHHCRGLLQNPQVEVMCDFRLFLSRIRFLNSFNKWGVSHWILIFSLGLTGWGMNFVPSSSFNSRIIPTFPMSMVMFFTTAPAESHFRISSFKRSA